MESVAGAGEATLVTTSREQILVQVKRRTRPSTEPVGAL